MGLSSDLKKYTNNKTGEIIIVGDLIRIGESGAEYKVGSFWQAPTTGNVFAALYDLDGMQRCTSLANGLRLARAHEPSPANYGSY